MHVLDMSQNEEVLRFSLPLECEHCSTHTGSRKNHRVSLRSHLQLGNYHFGGRNARTALWPGLITVRTPLWPGLITVRTALWPGLVTVRPALVPRRERGDPRPCLLSLTCFPEEPLYKQRFLPKPGQGNGAGGTRRGRQPARPAPRPLCHFAQLPLIPALKSPRVVAADGLDAGLPGSARVGCKQGLSIGFGGASESSGSSQSHTSILATPQRLLEMGAAGLRS